MLRALGTSANRVGDVHEGLNVGDLVRQYRRAYVTLRNEYGVGKIPNQKLKNSFALIKTKGRDNSFYNFQNFSGHEKYAGVIKPLAKTDNEELWGIIQELFERNDAEVRGPGKVAAKSTAPFNGMSAKWAGPVVKVKIPDSRKIFVLQQFLKGEIQLKSMKKTWGSEFNRACFVYTVNSVLRTAFPLDDFESALGTIPPIKHGFVTKRILQGNKIKATKAHGIQMPQEILDILKEVKKTYKPQQTRVTLLFT
jgi:hypothetical protein